MSASIVVPDGWFEGPEGEKALDRAHAYGVSWQREGEEVFGPAYLLEAVAAIRRMREVRALPDRETIARAAFEGIYGKPISDDDWRVITLVPEDARIHQLVAAYRAADAVLALFGQEGQR